MVPPDPRRPHDRSYADWLQDQTDALEAWRKNLLLPQGRSFACGY